MKDETSVRHLSKPDAFAAAQNCVDFRHGPQALRRFRNENSNALSRPPAPVPQQFRRE
jgi:hypothetical protein